MNDSPENIAKLKSLIDLLGDNWNETWPTKPSSYEGTENVLVFLYCESSDWPDFYYRLRNAREEMDMIIDTEQ